MIKLSIDSQLLVLSDTPSVYQQNQLRVEVRPKSQGLNTKGVQDIVVRQGDSKSVLHLSSRNGKHSASMLDEEQITASRVY